MTRGHLQANRWETHHYQCDVTSSIAGFQNGAEICCTLSSQKYGIFTGLADSFPTFFLNQY